MTICSLAKKNLECPAQSKYVAVGQVAAGLASVALIVMAVALISLFAPVVGIALLGASFSASLALWTSGGAFLTALALTLAGFGFFYLQSRQDPTLTGEQSSASTPTPPAQRHPAPEPQQAITEPSPAVSSLCISPILPPELENFKDEIQYFVRHLPEVIKAKSGAKRRCRFNKR